MRPAVKLRDTEHVVVDDPPLSSGGGIPEPRARSTVRESMRRRTPWILLLALLLPLSARAGEDITFVFGVGGRVSGRLPVLVVGDVGKEAEAFLAAVPERYGLTLVVEYRPDLDATARAAVLVVLANARHADVPRIRARLQKGRTFFVALREEPGVRDAVSRFAHPECYRPAEEGAPAPAMLDGLRGAILETTAVLHLDSVFGVTGRVVDGSLRIEVTTVRPGETTMSLLTVEGEEVLPPGPVRPVPLADLADPDGTLVRLSFRGADGIVDEKRVAVADLLPAPAAGLAVHGSWELVVGEPAAFRAEVVDDAGRPRVGVAVRAELLGKRVDGVTDAAGAATVAFPAPAEPGEGMLLVRADLPDSPVSVRVPIRIVPRPRRLLLSADRPLAEPGGRVRLRALLLDGLDRTAIEGEPVTLDVSDPRGRQVASFDGKTDRFGAATFELPLAEGIVEGDYRLVARAGGVEAARRLPVTSRPRPPFDVDVRVGRAEDGGVLGTVLARTFTGEPIADARVDVAAEDATAESRLDREGRGAFALPAAAYGTARVTVSGEGVTATREVPLPPPGVAGPEVRAWCEPWPLVRGVPGEIRLQWDGGARDLDLVVDGERVARKNVSSPQVVTVVPSSDRLDVGEPADRSFPVVEGFVVRAAASGAADRPLPFEVLATRRDGPVVVDLLGPAGLLQSVTATLADGRAADAFAPPRRAGDFRIVVRGERSGRADVRIVESKLAVRLEPSSAEARPGEPSSVRVAVTDGEGRGVPALVELRGYDPAWLAAAGDPGAGLGELPPERGSPVVALLARVEPGKRREALAARAAAAAAESRDLRLPWGPGFFAARGAWYYDLVGEPAAAGLPWIRRFGESRAGELPTGVVPVLLPVPAEEPRSRENEVSRALGWLAAHQEEDGSWGPAELEPAGTGIVLLAFLGAGETHKHGWYREVVKRGILHLKRQQGEGGFFGDPKRPGARLDHAVATLAFVEAYAMTGSPLFKRTCETAVEALLARQRPDGGFAEEGAAEGSLVLAVWAAHALASARIAGLLPERTNAGEEELTRWLDRRVDPATGIARPSGEDVRHSPFGGLDRPPAAAALTGATRCVLARVRGRFGIPAERRDIPGVPAIPPGDAMESLHTLWWGRNVAWRIGGDVWKEWWGFSAPALRARQEADGSFAPGVDRIGRPAATAFGALCLEFWYRYARVFEGRVVGRFDPTFASVEAAPRVRTDFPPLLPLPFTVATAEDGTATVPLVLPDSITTWDLRAGAFDGRGGFASARAGIRTTLPVGLDLAAPERLVVGDRVVLFVRVRSRREADAKAILRVETTGGVELSAAAERTIDLPAGAAVAIPVGVTATAAGPASIRVEARAGADADAIERSIDVRGAGVPFAVSRLFGPGEAAGFADRMPAGARGLRARLVVSSGLLADATGALRGLLRRPTGCFEQTSATLYPSLFAYRFLRAAGRLDGAAAARAEENLRLGYQRLLSFETPDGGFSLFPGGAMRSDLTALGIHELLDLKAVLPVDDAVIRRAAEALARWLPEEPEERIYALAALRRAGEATPPESVRALVGEDPYRAALAFRNGLLDDGDREWLCGLFSRTGRRLAAEVEWRPEGPTLFAGAAGSTTETTALVTLALARLSYGPELIGGGTAAILAARRPDGAWATTRETVAALRALIVLGGDHPARGTLTVRRPGRPDVAAAVGGDAPTEVDLGAWDAGDEVSFRFDGTGRPWATLVVDGTADVPTESPGPLAVKVEWPEAPAPARVGGAVAAVVRLANRSDREVYAPFVEVPVPAGLVPDRTSLPPRAEVKGGRVFLYLESLSAGGSVEFRIPFVATYPGRFVPGVASARPYYEPARTGYDVSVGNAIEIDR